jgi:hypothetical protein
MKLQIPQNSSELAGRLADGPWHRVAGIGRTAFGKSTFCPLGRALVQRDRQAGLLEPRREHRGRGRGERPSRWSIDSDRLIVNTSGLIAGPASR